MLHQAAQIKMFMSSVRLLNVTPGCRALHNKSLQPICAGTNFSAETIEVDVHTLSCSCNCSERLVVWLGTTGAVEAAAQHVSVQDVLHVALSAIQKGAIGPSRDISQECQWRASTFLHPSKSQTGMCCDAKKAHVKVSASLLVISAQTIKF